MFNVHRVYWLSGIKFLSLVGLSYFRKIMMERFFAITSFCGLFIIRKCAPLMDCCGFCEEFKVTGQLAGFYL